MYALDTNTLIFFFQGKGNVAQNLLNVPPRDVAIPAIVVYELEVGIAKSRQPSKRRGQLDTLLGLISVLALDAECAKRAAAIHGVLEAGGLAIGPMDVLIAATALAHGAILVTHNTKEFSRVKGLALDDWF